MFYFIECLRAIATALIANSHFKGVYPSDILSFGGGMGLALFFMISGYLLANINHETKFLKWYGKRVIRIYIPLYIVKLIQFAIGNLQITSGWDFFKKFVFPGSWFGGAILVMYIVYYIFVKYFFVKYKKKSIFFLGILATLCFIFLYVFRPSFSIFSIETLTIQSKFAIETPYFITQFVWLICMILGLYLRHYREKRVSNKSKVSNWIMVAIMVILFAFTKLIIQAERFENWQFLLAISYVGFAYALFKCFMDVEDWLVKFSETRLWNLIKIVSQCSLEIYYIQFLWIHLLKDVAFPVNLLLLIIAIVLSAYIIHLISEWIIGKIMNVGKLVKNSRLEKY